MVVLNVWLSSMTPFRSLRADLVRTLLYSRGDIKYALYNLYRRGAGWVAAKKFPEGSMTTKLIQLKNRLIYVYVKYNTGDISDSKEPDHFVVPNEYLEYWVSGGSTDPVVYDK